jgi:ribosome-binding factor A
MDNFEIANPKIDSPKKRRLEHIIRSLVAEVIEFDLKDSRLGMVTILDVKITGDFKHAKIYWSVLGQDNTKNSSALALESAKGKIRSVLARQISLRTAPTLEFVYDEVEAYVKSMDELLEQARQKDAKVKKLSSKAEFANLSDAYKKPI